MAKREVVWLLIRIVGVYLLIHAFRETLEYMVWLVNVANMPEFSGIRIGLIVRIVFLAFLALYLLKDGRFLFRLLNYEADAGSQN